MYNYLQGKHVPGADVSATNVKSARAPRQYMNRRGGFNRPLEAEATNFNKVKREPKKFRLLI